MIREVAGRALRKCRYLRSKIQYRHPGLFRSCGDCDGLVLHDEMLAYGDHASHPRLRELYMEFFGKSIDEEMAFAEDICRHSFSFLGHRHQHGEEIQWNLDPVSNKPWESGFSLDIIFRGPQRTGDIKLVWELNKQQYFFILAKMYLVTGAARYCNEVIAQIDSWIDRNPPYKGVNWISALEIGARVMSWIMVYPFIKEHLTGRTLTKYLGSLMLQLNFIEENLSYGKFPNTHLIGEASALIVGGLFLNAKDSKRWVSKGTDILSRQILDLSSNDGVYKEQSLDYQRFFLDYYYLILILLKRNGTGFSELVEKKIETMTEFLMYALRPDGTSPSFGDADDARGIYIKHACIDDYRSTLALGAAIFNRGDFRFVAGEMPEEILWLMGSEGVERYHKLTVVPPTGTSKAYEQGGYFIMRNGWDRNANYLIFDCGPLGHGPSGHGHADSLSFQLSSRGFPLFIDPGTYSYNLDYAWRDYFRSTPAHNTITVDESDQSEMKDRMSWKTFASARCNFWLSTQSFDIADGVHDGYERLKAPVLHRRVIFYDKKDCWIIADRLQCSSDHVYDFHLHLHPACTAAIDHKKSRVDICSAENKKISVHFIDDNRKSEMMMFCGDEETKRGWYSESYGLKRPGQTIRWRKAAMGTTWFITFINSSSKDYRLSCEWRDAYLQFSLHDEEEKKEKRVYYSLEGAQGFRDTDLKFRGKYLFVSKRHGEVSDIYAKDLTKFETEFMAIASEKEIQSLAIVGRNCEVCVAEEDIQEIKLFCSGGIKTVINGKKIESENIESLQGDRV